GIFSFMQQTAVVRASSFDVNTVADATDINPGDGICEIDDVLSRGVCTLRAAIEEANALPGIDEIRLKGGTHFLTIVGSDDIAYVGDLDITEDLIISGDGITTTIIDGGGIDSIFHISPSAAVTISNVTLRNGNAADGGGILNEGGILALNNVALNGNRATPGNGGGINNAGGSVVLSNTIILNNSADASGGAIFNGGSLSIMNSAVSTNTAGLSGGGIIQLGGVMTVTNSTFSGNIASDGGGIYNNGDALITNSTINNNSASFGAGIVQFSGDLRLKNSIVSNSLLGGDCAGSINSNGHNLDSDDTCNLIAPTDLPGVDPMLDVLQDNGGDTLTHALLLGSPAIQAGDNTKCPATDQRGVTRKSNCDIGAYEIEIDLNYLPLVLNLFPTVTPEPPTGDCNRMVPVFTTDGAPTDGTLEFHVLFGELGRVEGYTKKVWNVAAGQQISNDLVDVSAPKWVRLWWRPDGDSMWYLLPSQYWVGDGTVASEYGVSCGTDPVPSYHTSFANAIPESQVPIFTLP
ncbi:MAG: CSLREA domain-containing protein, partial [Chloroflexi bacterium]|nr:CSLREA domain-containing protein [Chloroflexota bacterium]